MEFARRRASKKNYWDAIKQTGDAALTLGSSIAGGMVGDLSRVGGYINPFMPVEQTEAGAQAIQEGMQYLPEQPNPLLQGLMRQMGTAQQDIERGVDALNVEESIPYKAYQRLPDRVKGIVRTAADWAM